MYNLIQTLDYVTLHISFLNTRLHLRENVISRFEQLLM